MTTIMRQTPADLKRENDAMNALAARWECEWKKLGEMKYRIDGYFHRGREVLAWAEYKHYSKSGFYGMNVAKYRELCETARLTEVLGFLVFTDPEGVGYIKVWDAIWAGAKPTLVVAGGTPTGRQPNPDDVEPMMMFSPADVTRVPLKNPQAQTA